MEKLTNRLENGKLIEETLQGWKALNELANAIEERQTLREVIELRKNMDAVFDELASRFVTEDTFSDYMKMGLPITKDQFKNLKSFLETLDDDPLYASSILPEIREFFSILTIRYNQRGIKNGKH